MREKQVSRPTNDPVTIKERKLAYKNMTPETRAYYENEVALANLEVDFAADEEQHQLAPLVAHVAPEDVHIDERAVSLELH